MNGYHELAMELIKGAYDLHTHPSPSHFPRALDDVELMREADAYGMAGVMIKSHYEPTGARAWLANAHAGVKTKAYGGVALNWPVGGLNPFAVASAVKMGAKCVWMPTRDSRHCLSFGDMPGDFFSRPGITIYDDRGKVAHAVYEIFEVAKAEGVYVASGHLSPEETVAFCRAGADVKANVILTHPDWDRTKLPLDVQLMIADMGVLIEKVGSNIHEGAVTEEAMADSIRKIGAERIFMSTDCGVQGRVKPAEGMVQFIEQMLNQGIGEEAIRTMTVTVPKRIVTGH